MVERQRRILHCDMDCFYAAVHQRDDPSLRGKPVVVGGRPASRGVVAAASYEARRFGVHSAMPASRAVKLCPKAVFIRPEFEKYRAESARIFDIYREFTEAIQPLSLDEAYLDVTEVFTPFGTATNLAKEIRRRVKGETGLTVSVGVAPNKLIAKIASDQNKPDGLTVVAPAKVLGFLAPLPVSRLHGVGPVTTRKLEEAGIQKVGDIRRYELVELRHRFGSHGEWLYHASRGIDNRPVESDRVRKSLGTENTYSQDIEDADQCLSELERFTQAVCRRLNEKRMSAGSVTVKVRFPDFETVTRCKALKTFTRDPEEILPVVAELYERANPSAKPVRLLGVTASNLVVGEPVQLRLFK